MVLGICFDEVVLLGSSRVFVRQGLHESRGPGVSSDSESARSAPAGGEGRVSSVPSCLVLHGLGGGPYELGPLIEALEAAGCRVHAPVLPGHDGPGPFMPHSHWRDWERAVVEHFDALSAAGSPVTVVGFSTGATLALRLALVRPIAGMVLLAPFLAIRHLGGLPFRARAVLGPAARLVRSIPRRGPAVRDPEMRRWAASQDRFRTFSMIATESALELIEQIEPRVGEIHTPTLIIQGRLDTVVDPSRADWLYHRLGSTEKRLLIMDRSDHLLALDRDRKAVITKTLDFCLDRPIGCRREP